jgi:hypothetical protein
MSRKLDLSKESIGRCASLLEAGATSARRSRSALLDAGAKVVVTARW